MITIKKEEFDWFKVLDYLIKGDLTIAKNYVKLTNPITFAEEHSYYMTLVKLSSDWVTCACGQLCQSLERNDEGMPLDRIIRSLGEEFYSDIVNTNFKVAKETLEKIEKRTIQLLNEKES